MLWYVQNKQYATSLKHLQVAYACIGQHRQRDDGLLLKFSKQ